MDTTPEYIKMCGKAGEIQAAWKPKEWDYYREREHEAFSESFWLVLPEDIADSGMCGSVYVMRDGAAIFNHSSREEYIWLPRQDQLLDLLWPGFNKMERGDPVYLIWELADETKGEKRMQNRWRKFLSLEQLYLAMVMQRMHKKRWSGEEWVRI